MLPLYLLFNFSNCFHKTIAHRNSCFHRSNAYILLCIFSPPCHSLCLGSFVSQSPPGHSTGTQFLPPSSTESTVSWKPSLSILFTLLFEGRQNHTALWGRVQGRYIFWDSAWVKVSLLWRHMDNLGQERATHLQALFLTIVDLFIYLGTFTKDFEGSHGIRTLDHLWVVLSFNMLLQCSEDP